MPHHKHVGSRAQPASETHSIDTERMMSHRTCRQLLSRHPCEQCAQRTVMSMWSMSMACMGAWLGGRRLIHGGGRTHRTQRERPRAHLQVCTVRLQAGVSVADTEDPLTCDRRRRLRSRLGVCTARTVCAVHTTFAFAVLCHAEALRGPSFRVCSIFRKSKRCDMKCLYLAVQHVRRGRHTW